MTVHIHQLATRTPAHAYGQSYARDRMIEWLPGKRNRRLLRGIYDRSGIDTRNSVLPDFSPGREPILFRTGEGGRLIEPGTEARNDCYAEHARGLAELVGREALVGAEGFVAADVTHVVTVSCTGFMNPGLDIHLVRVLGLSAGVERYHLGFMGCYAAIPALRMAWQFCRADPRAVVLVVCVELCSLHLQLREDPDSFLANAIFADGAGAAVVSARAPAPGRGILALQGFYSALATEGAGDMAWSIGDRGFRIRLSTYVPDIVAANIGAIVDATLRNAGANRADIAAWAVHPGGRAILDKVEEALGTCDGQLGASRAVLRECGNMSSATLLFVLKRCLAGLDGPATRLLCAMAFGPGLAIETALLRAIPARPAGIAHSELPYAATAP
jgi:predicted naringenin-chalcone synthase